MRGTLFAVLLAGAAWAAPTDPLLLTRSNSDAELTWTVDLGASGYEVRRITDETLIPTIDSEPVHITVPTSVPSFPVLDPMAIPAPPNLYYYSVRSTGSGCVPGTDTDGDRLDDCVETNTGIFVDSSDAGTDPTIADTDGDAIDDGDEVLGTLAGLDLPGLGANPVHRDVFIEYDWFDDTIDCGMHSHQPTPAMADLVTTAFANAPIMNPDRTTGIALHHDFGQGGRFVGGNFIDDPDGVIAGNVFGGDFRNYKLAHFDPLRLGYFHYCLLPHRYDLTSNSSGYAEIDGNDFIVSLYCAFTTQNVANTIVHEIGHNFNLRHGGFENCNNKPNYNSVMNYTYQFPGVDDDCTPPANGVLDYSRGVRIPLDESLLFENAGTCGTVPWDWNANSMIDPFPVLVNLNPGDDGGCGGGITILRDNDDWASVLHTGIKDTNLVPRPVEGVECHNRPPGF